MRREETRRRDDTASKHRDRVDNHRRDQERVNNTQRSGIRSASNKLSLATTSTTQGPSRKPSSANSHTRSHVGNRSSSYHANRDAARTLYLDRRDAARRNSEERRERERRNRIRDRHKGKDDHHDNNRHGGGHKHGGHRHGKHHDIIVDHKHRHGNGCGHHYYNNRWNDFPRSHRHHHGCGHHRHAKTGLWISFNLGHQHHAGCGHFFENGFWLSHSGARHHHHAGCGHYYYRGFWHNTSRYHIHGAGCGHYYYDNVWNDFPHTHIHSDHCGHLYDGSRWLIVESDTHRHSVNCGHYSFAGRWFTYPRTYYTMNREDSFYFFVDLGDHKNRNFPEWAHERYFDEGRETDIFRSSKSIAKGYAAFAKRRYYDAILEFRSASQAEPDNAIIYLARAQANIAVKDYRAAFDDIKKGMELFPEWSDVYMNITELYSNSEDLAKHTEELKQWVERYPRDFKAHFVLGYFYYFHQEYDEAKNELLYALSWNDQLEPAQNLMDHILEFEAESEVTTFEETPEYEEPEVTTE